METLITILIVGLGVWIVYRIAMSPPVPKLLDRWHIYFDFTHFSVQEFYKLIEDEIKKHEHPDVSVSKVTFSESGPFSHNRQYLRISRKSYVFDICAAPFGKDYFISWWFGEKRSILNRIPVIKWFRQTKSYYDLDAESMFKDGIRGCVQTAIDKLSNYKGVRTLPEIENTAASMTK